MAQAPGGAGDGGCRMRHDMAERFEPRSKLRRGDEPFPFIVMAAPVVKAVRQGGHLAARMTQAWRILRVGRRRRSFEERRFVLGRAPVRIAAREAAPAIERIALTAPVRTAQRARMNGAETEQRIGRKDDVAIGAGLRDRRRRRVRACPADTKHAEARTADGRRAWLHPCGGARRPT